MKKYCNLYSENVGKMYCLFQNFMLDCLLNRVMRLCGFLTINAFLKFYIS